MDNDATVTDETVADVKATATEQKQTADEPEKTEPEQKKVDADEIVKKLQKRIGAEQSKKNSYKQQLEEALDKIKQLESGKSVKELSDKDKARKDTDEKDKRIAELEAQIAHRKTLDETDQVLRDSGLSVPSDVLGFLVSDNADTTYANVKAFIDYTESVKDSVREEFRKGHTPRMSGKTVREVTQEQFMRMNQSERVKLYRDNPELFKKLTTGGN